MSLIESEMIHKIVVSRQTSTIEESYVLQTSKMCYNDTEMSEANMILKDY